MAIYPFESIGMGVSIPFKSVTMLLTIVGRPADGITLHGWQKREPNLMGDLQQLALD